MIDKKKVLINIENKKIINDEHHKKTSKWNIGIN